MMPKYASVPVALLAGFGLLWVAKPVLIPVSVALLLALLLSPVVARLERSMPSVLATMLTVGAALLAVAGAVILVGSQLAALQTKLPELMTTISKHLQIILGEVSPRLGLSKSGATSLLQKGMEGSVGSGGSAALTALSFTVETVGEVTLIVIMTFFMLFYRKHATKQLRSLERRGGSPVIGPAAERLVGLGQSYLAGLGLVMVIIGAADTAGLLLVGAPFAAVFGFLGALSVMIPYLGIMILAPTSAVITLLVSGSGQLALTVLGIFSLIHFLEGNLISPYFVGAKIDLNPLSIIIAVLVGGNLWGAAGMVLFVPLFGILKLTLDQLPQAAPLAKLLGPVRATRTKSPPRHSRYPGALLVRWYVSADR